MLEIDTRREAAIAESYDLKSQLEKIEEECFELIEAIHIYQETANARTTAHLIEECVEGTEITVPVIGNEEPSALPIVEIVTGAEFYDLKVKYEPSAMHHVIPARLEPGVYTKAQELAVRAHRALGCRGCSRSDFIVTPAGEPIILETNTIPGMTAESLLPDSARHGGIEFSELCTLFVPLFFNKVQQLASLDFTAVMNSISEPVSRIQYYLDEFFALPESTFSLSEALSSGLCSMVNFGSLNTLVSSLFNVVLSSVVAIFSISFITFFFLKEEGLFYAMVSAVFPERYHENITRALDSITVLLSRYFTGILTESLLLMIAVSLVMMAFGMHTVDACFIGLVMGVMNVVPYAGPLIGGVMSVCIGVMTPIEGTTVGHTVLVIVASLLVLKGLDDFVLQPTLYSARVKAHPLEVFIVILIAGSVAGILGMLLAIPSYTVLRVFAKEFFSQFSLVRKLTRKI